VRHYQCLSEGGHFQVELRVDGGDVERWSVQVGLDVFLRPTAHLQTDRATCYVLRVLCGPCVVSCRVVSCCVCRALCRVVRRVVVYLVFFHVPFTDDVCGNECLLVLVTAWTVVQPRVVAIPYAAQQTPFFSPHERRSVPGQGAHIQHAHDTTHNTQSHDHTITILGGGVGHTTS
jgi:hypothetical protein